MCTPSVYHFWGVYNRYISGFHEIIVDELSSIGGGDTWEEALYDVTFKMCDEIDRLICMGKHITPYTEEETTNFATKWHEELRTTQYPGNPDSDMESWSLVRITVDMANRPPGKTQEELDSIAAFERQSWTEYLAEIEKLYTSRTSHTEVSSDP